MTEITGDFIPLAEKAVRRDGTIAVKLIGEGWGSSGYYGRDVLERDVPRAFPAGTHQYWNHPTLSEQEERPERDLRDLAAVTITDPKWQDNGPAGPGMYADARVFSGYQDTINEIAEHIGVSIRGQGKVQQGEAAGKTGRIVEEISDGLSVDFVTKPGAGGAIVNIFESAPGAKPLPGPQETSESEPPEAATNMEDDMSELQEVEAARDQALEELKETKRQLEEREQALAKANERLLLREARDFVGKRLADAELPDLTKNRLAQALSSNPILKDGKLDEAAMKERVAEAIEEAEAEVNAILGFDGQVRGQGAPAGNGNGATSVEEAQKITANALADIGYGTPSKEDK